MTSNIVKYTREQVTQFYERIRLPEALRIYEIGQASAKAARSYLVLLQKHHLVSIPFENLSLHYSPYRRVVLHPDELFRKIVGSNEGRGGYCMELNAIFGTLLRTIGYSLYATGARVHNGKDFDGWNHMVNIVTIGDSRYIVDVGFGSNYVPIQPIRLIHDTAGVTNVEPASARLVYKSIENSTTKYQKLWVYQHRLSSDVDFKDMYCFTDIEFLARDFEVMNYWTSTSPTTIFTQKVICNKMILGQQDEIVGTLSLQADLKKRVGVETEVLKEFQSEDDRLEALQAHFGIAFGPKEREAIQNTAQELR